MFVDTAILYFASICLFTIYILIKYRIRNYIFSPFNIPLIVYSFTLLISPVILYSDSCWIALKISSSSEMTLFSNESIKINCVGFLVYLLSLMANEFNRIVPRKLVRVASTIKKKVDSRLFDLLFIFSTVLWNFVCIKYCKGYPLLNGNRTFYLNSVISPIYLFLNESIVFMTIYYTVRSIRRKKVSLFAAVGVVIVALQGNRSALIIGIIIPMIILYLYQSVKLLKNNDNVGDKMIVVSDSRAQKRKIVKRIVAILPIILIMGLWIQCVRKNIRIDVPYIIHEVINGNTFSDLRDGAYILKGFTEKTGRTFLHGKTYFSGIISFIPSGISTFRYTWSWGRFTTIGLFGISDHFGLRGGNSLEAFINFGWIGVVIFPYVQGYIAAQLEKIFYIISVQGEKRLDETEYIVFYIVYMIMNTLSSSSNAYNIYVVLFVMTMTIIISEAIGSRTND